MVRRSSSAVAPWTGCVNPVAAFGEINLNGDSMLYIGFVEHSKFDRLKGRRA